MMRRMFGPKTKVVYGECRKLHKKSFTICSIYLPYYDDPIKETGDGGTCNSYRIDRNCVQNFDQET